VNQPAEDSAQKKVLVVDDAEAIRRLVCSTLAQFGFACVEAADGVEALEVIDRLLLDLDLVLTDLVMPRMDGKELAGRLSALQPDLRVMFMSGFSDDPPIYGRESLFIAKPFTTNVLVDKVRQVLNEPWHGLPRGGATLDWR